jgi:hypothetical protein
MKQRLRPGLTHLHLPIQAALTAAEEYRQNFPSEQREVGPLIDSIHADIVQRRQATENRRRQEYHMRMTRHQVSHSCNAKRRTVHVSMWGVRLYRTETNRQTQRQKNIKGGN